MTRPFSEETLIRVANKNGVALKRDLSCSGGASVESASNIVIGDNVQVDGREGQVICDIVDLPFAVPPFGVRQTKYRTDRQSYLDVANVDCAIFPSARGQIARLKSALKALAQAPIEQRSCPQARSTPVTLKRLIETAKKKGLQLVRDARCIEPGVVAQASTYVPYGQHKNDDTVFYDQGDVTCLLRKSAMPGAKTIRTTNLSGGKRFDILNVSCKALPSLGHEAMQIGRVRATMEDLARTQ